MSTNRISEPWRFWERIAIKHSSRVFFIPFSTFFPSTDFRSLFEYFWATIIFIVNVFGHDNNLSKFLSKTVWERYEGGRKFAFLDIDSWRNTGCFECNYDIIFFIFLGKLKSSSIWVTCHLHVCTQVFDNYHFPF